MLDVASYFAPAGAGYEGRMFNPLSGAHGGTEDFFGGPFGELMGGLSMCFRLGGYMVESNQGTHWRRHRPEGR